MDNEVKLQLFIITKSRSEICEQKYQIPIENDDFITHTTNGWTIANLMVKYLNWLSGQMDKQPLALLLDAYRTH